MSSSNEKPKRQPISWKLLLGVFVGSLLLTGTVVFALLSLLLPDAPQGLPIVTGNTNGVRTLDNPQAVSDVTMRSHTGEAVSLSDWRGKNVLIAFGYTYCPDVCPLTISDMKQVHNALGAAADDVQFVFISVDGARDTPQRLQFFLDAHSVSEYIIGLSGTAQTLRPLQSDYGMVYQLNPPDENSNYSVDHTARLYLLDAQGRLTHSFAYGTDTALIAETIQQGSHRILTD